MVRKARWARLGGDELKAIFNHLIDRAGNLTLMSEAVRATLCDQFADWGAAAMQTATGRRAGGSEGQERADIEGMLNCLVAALRLRGNVGIFAD